MKSIVYSFLFFLSSFALSAQHDTVYFSDGARAIVNIEEMTATTVKYRKAENPTGPVYIIQLAEIASISYRNGRKETFKTPMPNAPVATRTVTQHRGIEKPRSSDKIVDPNGKLKYSGPRMGCTYIGEGTAATRITDIGKVPIISQFGWQFETRIFTSQSGFSGLAEFVPLIGGMEQGMFLPSASFLFGLRTKGGWEVAFGPNLSWPSGLGAVLAVGTSFHVDEVYFPVNIAFVPSVSKSTTQVLYNGKKMVVTEHTGFRVSLVVGFNTQHN